MSTTTVPNKPDTTKNPGQSQEKSQQPQQQQPQPQQPKQSQASMFNAEAIKKNWKQLTANAKAKWSKLTEDELTKSNGDEQQLTTLVKDRYNLSRDDANRQVTGFFSANASK